MNLNEPVIASEHRERSNPLHRKMDYRVAPLTLRGAQGMARLLAMTIHLYRWCISPLLGCNCRFHPTCSAYALEAVRAHGALKGSWLTLRRLLRCHPWGAAGCDPVPTKETA